jgi:hypothetical protein
VSNPDPNRNCDPNPNPYTIFQPFVRYRDWGVCVDAGMTNIPGRFLLGLGIGARVRVSVRVILS